MAKDKKYSKYTQNIQARNKKSKNGQFIPFDLAKDKEHRRTISSSFNATSRDAWQHAHANKTNPPEVGKYKPKTQVIWAKPRATDIRKTPPNEGYERKMRKGLQQMQCDERIFRVLDKRVAAGKMHVPGKTSERSKSQIHEIMEQPENENLDTNLLSLAIPKQQSINLAGVSPRGPSTISTHRHSKTGQQSPKERSPPCTDFTVSYMPNGQQYKKNTLNREQLKRAYHVDHWKKFAAPTYPTVVTTNEYHLVRDKDTFNYYIEQNKVDKVEARNPRNNYFHRMTDRKEIDTFFKLNDSRFENINKTPKVLSSVSRQTGIAFVGHKKRDPLWPEHEQTTFYETQKENTMKQLTHGILNWDKIQTGRTPTRVDPSAQSYD